MSSKKRVKDFLDELHIHYITMQHPTAYTAQELAHMMHISGKLFAKTVILRADGEYMMAIVPATHKVNFNLFKKVAMVNNVELAHEDDFMKLFPQCEVGAMPPFGNMYEMTTYVDKTIAEDDEIYFNASNHFEAIKMKYKDFQKLVHPIVGTFAIRN